MDNLTILKVSIGTLEISLNYVYNSAIKSVQDIFFGRCSATVMLQGTLTRFEIILVYII